MSDTKINTIDMLPRDDHRTNKTFPQNILSVLARWMARQWSSEPRAWRILT